MAITRAMIVVMVQVAIVRSGKRRVRCCIQMMLMLRLMMTVFSC